MDSWFYVSGGARLGPVTLEQLRGMLTTGGLAPDAIVWREGFTGWLQARQVPELASAVPQVAQPPAMPPAIPGPPAMNAPPPMPMTPMSAGLRILTLIAAVVVIGAFFAPYFYTNITFVVDQSLIPTLAQNEQEAVKQLDTLALGTNLFGWNLWFGIVAFALGCGALVASILDLSMPRVRVMRVINKWMLFVLFAGIFGVSAAGLTLGLCKVGLSFRNADGIMTSFSSLDPMNAQIQKGAVEARKKIREATDGARGADKAEAEKRAIQNFGDPALIEQAGWKFTAVPIAVIAAVVGGALGLIGAIAILAKGK